MRAEPVIDGIRLAAEGPIRILRFDRPEKKNAITSAMYAALAAELEAASSDEAVGAVVLFGEPGVFTAGHDIGDFLAMAAEARGLAAPVLRFLRALASLDRPLLAGIDGIAVGIGATLLFHCDYVLATPRSMLRTPFTALGLTPEAASSLLAPRVMGTARAFELLVMGADFDAEAAKAAGLVNAVVGPAELEALTLGAARRLCGLPRGAVLAARRLLKGSSAEILARIEAEAEIFAERLASAEAQAAFAAFLDRAGA